MSNQFFVVGGEYADTTFTRIAQGREEERHGPFSEKDARDFWRAITGKTVDNALIRYTIRADEDHAEEKFLVIGGEYSDTSFTTMAHGGEPERHGPFSKKEALDFWRAITGKTVDNAMVRYSLMSE